MALCMCGHCHRGEPLCLCTTYRTAPQARIMTMMSRSVWLCCWRSFCRLKKKYIYILFNLSYLHLFCSFSLQDSAKCVFVLHGHIAAVKSLSFCASGLTLVSGGIGGLLNIWSLQVRKKKYLEPLPIFLSEVNTKITYLRINIFRQHNSYYVSLLHLFQDGSVLQTVTGLGSVVSTTWIPNLGVAACFGRSKVIWNTSNTFQQTLRE